MADNNDKNGEVFADPGELVGPLAEEGFFCVQGMKICKGVANLITRRDDTHVLCIFLNAALAAPDTQMCPKRQF